jgi:U3 small nucleolar RNA-associated protein MPP10
MANTTGSTSSSMTSTSHTLTHNPLSRTAPKPGNSAAKTHPIVGMEHLTKALEPSKRHAFIQPSVEICDAAIEAVKIVLDGVAGGVCDEQAARLQARKRKRGDGEAGEGLRIRKVHTEGFGVKQVWEQARRVIDALRGEVERDLGLFEGAEEVVRDREEDKSGEMNGLVKTVRFGEDGFEVGSEDESLEDELDDGLEDGEDIEMGDGEADDDQELVDEEGEAGAEVDELPNMEDEEDYQDDYDDEEEPADVFVEDPNGLNDGFFSINDFNKQTEFLEQQDAAADPYTGEASDEEEIDWDADPMSIPAAAVSSSRRAAAMDIGGEDEEEEDDDEDGPTFGNADLNARKVDSDEDEDAHMNERINAGGDNTNDILYKDFFEPPPRKVGKGQRQANFLARQARKSKQPFEEDAEAEMERAIADVRRDLFGDNSEHEDSGDALSDADPSEPKSRKSAHERRQAKLAEEIRKLEAASVAKREWTLSGEARAADRPLNSLLEEDLDFERTGKPVPVITAEVSESIEELIKRRILAQEFDEVIRRRPDSETVPSNVRRGAFELDDSKPQQSLAEIYEEEHVKATNPDTYMSKADDKLKKQHQEIELLWKDVSAKLDALSSWHYKPKPPAPSLTVVADVATVSMEDAQPTTASGIAGGESMLAPQEVYKAGKDKHAIKKGEVVPKSGIPVARQEMTREEKLRRRRREKERIKKRGGVELNKKQEGKKTKEKRETVDELKKGGVKIIGRKGDIRDVDGNKLKAAPITNGAGGFKL